MEITRIKSSKSKMRFGNIRRGTIFQKYDSNPRQDDVIKHDNTFYMKLSPSQQFTRNDFNTVSVDLACRSFVEDDTIVKVFKKVELIVEEVE